MRLDIPEGDFEGYIFDCDGTVVDSMPLHYRAWLAGLEANGASFTFTEPMFYAAAGIAETDVTRDLNARFGTALDPWEVLRAKQEYFIRHMNEVTPVAAVEAIVRRLEAEGKPLSVASGSELVIVEPELEFVGLRECFPVVVTPELVERGKPAPDMFLLAAQRMGVAPERCLVFEDGQSGLDAAAAAGMASVFVPSAEERLKELAAAS